MDSCKRKHQVLRSNYHEQLIDAENAIDKANSIENYNKLVELYKVITLYINILRKELNTTSISRSRSCRKALWREFKNSCRVKNM